MAVYRSLASLLICLVMAGCGTFSSKGETELEFGIRAFEDGEHAYAAKLLQLSLDDGLHGLLDDLCAAFLRAIRAFRRRDWGRAPTAVSVKPSSGPTCKTISKSPSVSRSISA